MEPGTKAKTDYLQIVKERRREGCGEVKTHEASHEGFEGSQFNYPRLL